MSQLDPTGDEPLCVQCHHEAGWHMTDDRGDCARPGCSCRRLVERTPDLFDVR